MPRQSYQPWTMGELRRLREMRQNGLPTLDIALALDRSVQSVEEAIRRHRVPLDVDLGEYRNKRYWSARDDATLRSLYALGKAHKYIAFRLDRTDRAVHSRISRLGLKRRPYRVTRRR